MPLSVCIADSNELIQIGLQSVLTEIEELESVYKAYKTEELFYFLEEKVINVVLIDYTSVGYSIDVLPEILQKRPAVKIVAITSDQTGLTIINALKSGVMSHIKKDCDINEIKDAVVKTAMGESFFCGQILDTIRAESIDISKIKSEQFTCAPISLSTREIEIISLIAEGYTNAKIAEKLFISSHTVNTHRKNIMQKLGVNNTAGIVMYAVKANLVNANRFLFSGN